MAGICEPSHDERNLASNCMDLDLFRRLRAPHRSPMAQEPTLSQAGSRGCGETDCLNTGDRKRLTLRRTVTYTGVTADGFEVEATQIGDEVFHVLALLGGERVFTSDLVIKVGEEVVPHIEAYLETLR